VGLAYRELIGSLYESWTIGIERVYKQLIHSIIQRCKNGKKRVSRRKKENPHPVHILSYSETSPKERGNVGTEKGEEKLEN